MSDLSHLRLEDSPRTLAYSYAGPTPRAKPFELPPRDRVPHAQQLAASLRQAEAEVAAIRQTHPAADEALDGVPITLRSDAGCKLPLPSTERRRDGMELLSVHTDPSG